MKNWRGTVGAVCIVLAMLLTALAGFVYARPSVGAVSRGGETRGGEPLMVEAGTGTTYTRQEAADSPARSSEPMEDPSTEAKSTAPLAALVGSAAEQGISDFEVSGEFNAGDSSTRGGSISIRSERPAAGTRFPLA